MNLILAVIVAATTAAVGTSNVVDVVGSAAPVAAVGGSAKITSASTYYDRKEGFAFFSGNVFVDDAKYQLHADRAYVFMDGTNELKKIVALGHVAMTNENKRAYGDKVSYYRDPGMVVLDAGNGIVAEVREENPDGPRVIRGKKIKFWTTTQQVVVIDPNIDFPTQGGLGGLKETLGK